MTYGDEIRKLRTEASAANDHQTVTLCDKVLEQRVSGDKERVDALRALAVAFPDNVHLNGAWNAARARSVGQVMQWSVPEASDD